MPTKLSAAFAVIAAAAGIASAEPPRDAMEGYFAGEKRGGVILVGMGAAGVATGAALLTRDSDLARGAGYPALALGAAHLAAGIFVYVASDRRIDKFNGEIDRDPAAFARTERERMGGVRAQFLILEIVEGALIAGGIGAAIYGLSSDEDLVAGIGVGVAAEAAATLVFDIVADRRARHYIDALGSFTAAPVAGGFGARFALSF